MLPLRDNQLNPRTPIVTYTLVGLCVFIYLWDREWNPMASSIVFADLAMRPQEAVAALKPGAPDHFPIATLFTSLFLHANLLHLLGNMLFLLAFGNSVENALGHYRYALYYIFWGLAASATHVFVDSNSLIPTVGASGAIGGVLGSYFLLFPGNKIDLWLLIVPFIDFVVSAWVLLLVWFVWQIAVPQEGVANWAHIGGFLAGMITVLILGGRRKILGNMAREIDYDVR
jgi:membrane associated rhomboid family serine protease